MIKQRKVTVKTAGATLTYSEMGDIIVNSTSDVTITLPTGMASLWYHIHNIGVGIVSISNGSVMTTLDRYGSAVVLYNTTTSAWCYTKGGASSILASAVTIADSGGHYTSTTVEGALDELFTNVSDGKGLIATAITGKGGTATGDDTFTELASAISGLPSGEGGYDISDATALQSDIVNGKTAYIATGKVTGNYVPPALGNLNFINAFPVAFLYAVNQNVTFKTITAL